MRLPAIGLLCVLGCGAFVRPSPGEPPFVEPATTHRYLGEASPEDPVCHEAGACDKYSLEWLAGTSVRLTIESTEFSSWMEAECPGHPRQRVHVQPGETASIRFVRGGLAGACQILVAATTDEGGGEYTLAVSPPAAVEGLVPGRPLSSAARVARILARTTPQPAFALSVRDREAALKRAGLGFTPIGPPITRSLGAFEPVPVVAEVGYCYQVHWRLDGGAQWSDLMLRGLEAPTRLSGVVVSAPSEVVGPGGILGPVCPDTSGTLSFSLRPQQAPRRYEAPLGQGQATFQVLRFTTWPGLRTAGELNAALRSRIRGMTTKLRRQVPLSGPVEFSVPLAASGCAVVTLELEGASVWSDDVRQKGMSFVVNLPDADLGAGPGLVGPGVIADLGCPGVSGSFAARFAGAGAAALGTGTGTLMVRARPARPGEVAAERRMWKESARQAERDAARLKQEHCAKCRAQARGDFDAFDRCVRQWFRSGECD